MTAEEIIRRIGSGQVRGGSAIGRAAVQALALAVTEYEGTNLQEMRRRLELTGRELMRLMPVMATVANAVRAATRLLDSQATAQASATEVKAALQAWAEATVRRSEDSLRSLAQVGATLIPPDATVITHSFSDSVLRIFHAVAHQRKKITVIATESRPLLEGRRLLEEIAELGFNGELIPDAAVAARVPEAGLALVGADAILPSGAFVNKTGTFTLALAARYFGVPVYVAAETAKVDLRAVDGLPPQIDQRPPDELTEGWTPPGNVTVWNRFFEITPGGLVEGYITERGVVSAAAVALLAFSEVNALSSREAPR